MNEAAFARRHYTKIGARESRALLIPEMAHPDGTTNLSLLSAAALLRRMKRRMGNPLPALSSSVSISVHPWFSFRVQPSQQMPRLCQNQVSVSYAEGFF
jgi:hypothetical protein